MITFIILTTIACIVLLIGFFDIRIPFLTASGNSFSKTDTTAENIKTNRKAKRYNPISNLRYPGKSIYHLKRRPTAASS